MRFLVKNLHSSLEKRQSRSTTVPPVSVLVSMFSFSKITVTPRVWSIRTVFRHSTVFREKRDTDFVRMMSTRPRLQAESIRLNSFRFFVAELTSPSPA